MNGVLVTVDSNDALTVGNLQWPGALVSIAPLQYGDLIAQCPDGKSIGIERKTPRDFLDSIKDGRLLNQVAGLVGCVDFAYVVVTGWFLPDYSFASTGEYVAYGGDDNDVHNDFTSTKWQWHSLQGILLSIQELGCAVIYDTDYHGTVERLVNRSRGDVKVAARRDAYVFTPARNNPDEPTRNRKQKSN